jgi:methyl-accepting chemotaxis protein
LAGPSDTTFTKIQDQKHENETSYRTSNNILHDLVSVEDKEASIAIRESGVEVRRIDVVGMAAGVVLALFAGVVLALSITGPLARGVLFTERVEAGDLTRKLDLRDEVGKLAQVLNLMTAKLLDIVASIQEAPRRWLPSARMSARTLLP